MRERVRLILHQEALRAVPFAFAMTVVWVVLLVQERVPPTTWSFLIWVPGVTVVVFGIIIGVRLATGWQLLAPAPQALRRWERNLNLFLLWVLASLLAIAYIGNLPYLGLAIAIVGGILVGLVAVLNYEATLREERATRDRPNPYSDVGEDDQPRVGEEGHGAHHQDS